MFLVKKYIIYEEPVDKSIKKLEIVENRKSIKEIKEYYLDEGSFKSEKLGYNDETTDIVGLSLKEIKMAYIEYIVEHCKIISIKGDNEKFIRNKNKQEQREIRDLGHELHKLRIPLHKLSVECCGHENWNRYHHHVPIKMFNDVLEDLIANAVDKGNWASIELYDPLEGY